MPTTTKTSRAYWVTPARGPPGPGRQPTGPGDRCHPGPCRPGYPAAGASGGRAGCR